MVVDASEGLTSSVLDEISEVLHQLCQPLTVLRCRLEVARLLDTVESNRDAVTLGLNDCERLMHGIECMRNTVRRAAGEPDERTVEVGR